MDAVGVVGVVRAGGRAPRDLVQVTSGRRRRGPATPSQPSGRAPARRGVGVAEPMSYDGPSERASRVAERRWGNRGYITDPRRSKESSKRVHGADNTHGRQTLAVVADVMVQAMVQDSCRTPRIGLKVRFLDESQRNLPLASKLAPPPTTPLAAQPPAAPAAAAAPNKNKKSKKSKAAPGKEGEKKGMWARKLRVLVNKMVGSSHTLIALRLVRSKLRKREETNNNSLGHGHGRPQAPALAPALVPHADTTGAKVSFAQSHNGITTVEAAVAANNTTPASLPTAGFAVLSAPVAVVANNSVVVNTTVASASPPTSCPDSAGSGSDSASSGMEEDDEAERADGKSAPFELFLWSYPNPTTFSGTKDALVRELPCEVPQDSKGLRKNLRGKWKRLVKKKPEDSGGIPPELRDQLKQIYVY
ncbi:hypothetical protein KUF71_006886 [Frankliniella fusca]|uniref:Uncharacterized protein n=1 Tax=Frankliniella fusca TaxID=407009 RepID=A0AAE1HBB4_9NEOP|nr:hypothetical protein KUF71_006886 [Frankliniella fusca]